MGETNSSLVAHVGYDISPLLRVKLKNLTTRCQFNSLEWRNIVTHGQLKENLYIHNMSTCWLLFQCYNTIKIKLPGIL